jgi:hypothetical protein
VRWRALLLVLPVLLAACGSDGPSDYSEETRSNVLTPCATDTDRPIVGDVCACAYRSIRTRIPYERFEEIDEQLRSSPDAPLPDDLLSVIADCVIEVGEL